MCAAALGRFGVCGARFDSGVGVLCGQAEEVLVRGGERKLFVGEHVGADDASVSLRIVQIYGTIGRLVEVSGDAVTELDLVERLAVDRDRSGDVCGPRRGRRMIPWLKESSSVKATRESRRPRHRTRWRGASRRSRSIRPRRSTRPSRWKGWSRRSTGRGSSGASGRRELSPLRSRSAYRWDG